MEPRPFFSGMVKQHLHLPCFTELLKTQKLIIKKYDTCKGRGRASFQPAVYEVFANIRGLILGSCKLPQLHKNPRSYDIPYQLNIIFCWQTFCKTSDLLKAETKLFFHPQ